MNRDGEPDRRDGKAETVGRVSRQERNNESAPYHFDKKNNTRAKRIKEADCKTACNDLMTSPI